MAGSSRYTEILDANVLYPNLLRDILLSLGCLAILACWLAPGRRSPYRFATCRAGAAYEPMRTGVTVELCTPASDKSWEKLGFWGQ